MNEHLTQMKAYNATSLPVSEGKVSCLPNAGYEDFS